MATPLVELAPGGLAAAVVESSPDGYAVMDRELRYVLFNPAMERLAGKRAAETLGRSILDVFPFMRARGIEDEMRRVLAGEVVTTDGVHHAEADGTRKVYDRVCLPLRGAGGEVTGVVSIVRDATARHAAQEALRTTETKLLMAADATGIGLWTWDPATDAVTWEDTTCLLYGRMPGDVPQGRDAYLATIHPDDREDARELIVRGEIEGHWEHEYRIVRPDGAVRWLASRTRTVHTDRGDQVFGAVFDVTERKEAEERHRAAHRLEVVGQLTAGIAHNFNNMLMGMLPNLQLAARVAPKELLPLLRDAEQSAMRAAGVVRELMTYAGRGRGTSRRVSSIGPLVEQTVAFCRSTFDRRIELDVGHDASANADVDASQIEQAILNLLINARDALDDVETPRITVACERVVAAPELGGRAGAWIAIRVTDNGRGMDDATRARMFEPFFTTKPVGKGTGLGLATTQMIVREHGGFATCRSARGEGTTFSLYLPARPGEPISIEGAFPKVRTRSRDSMVLVVDDDDRARVATARMLKSAGFAVAAASTGDEALAVITDPARRIDLVLLDVSMPGLSGPQTRTRMLELAPALPVVFLTGYTFESEYGDPVLEKPLAAEELVSRIDEALRKAAG
ncbi:MAG TPA: PAS domain S-box protein [Kofleriaceae bacterium]|jgi:PAS domain S-box-containing protein